MNKTIFVKGLVVVKRFTIKSVDPWINIQKITYLIIILFLI